MCDIVGAQRRNVHSDRFIARQRPPAIVWFIAPGNGIVGDDFIRHFATLAPFFFSFSLSPSFFYMYSPALVGFFLLSLFFTMQSDARGVARATRFIRATRPTDTQPASVGNNAASRDVISREV